MSLFYDTKVLGGSAVWTVVMALGLHAAALGSNPILTSGLDLFPVVPSSTPPYFVIRQLGEPYKCFC